MDTDQSARRDVPLLPEQRIGAAIRQARCDAGLSLREMARRLNYGSHSTLSEYENGTRMPSEIVVEGYERLLRLRAGTLTAMLEAANIERHGDAWAKRRLCLPLTVRSGDHHADPQVVAVGPGHDRATGAVAASPWPAQPVSDGSDPDAAGCSMDAITVHSRRIALIEQRTIIGQIELRHCPRQAAAWGRFEGYGYLDHLARERTDLSVVIEVVRHGDGTRVATREPYCFDYMWSDLVTVDGSPCQARAAILAGAEIIARGETDPCSLS